MSYGRRRFCERRDIDGMRRFLVVGKRRSDGRVVGDDGFRSRGGEVVGAKRRVGAEGRVEVVDLGIGVGD